MAFYYVLKVAGIKLYSLNHKKGKDFPYSTPSVGPGADPGVQAVSLKVTLTIWSGILSKPQCPQINAIHIRSWLREVNWNQTNLPCCRDCYTPKSEPNSVPRIPRLHIHSHTCTHTYIYIYIYTYRRTHISSALIMNASSWDVNVLLEAFPMPVKSSIIHSSYTYSWGKGHCYLHAIHNNVTLLHNFNRLQAFSYTEVRFQQSKQYRKQGNHRHKTLPLAFIIPHAAGHQPMACHHPSVQCPVTAYDDKVKHCGST